MRAYLILLIALLGACSSTGPYMRLLEPEEGQLAAEVVMPSEAACKAWAAKLEPELRKRVKASRLTYMPPVADCVFNSVADKLPFRSSVQAPGGGDKVPFYALTRELCEHSAYTLGVGNNGQPCVIAPEKNNPFALLHNVLEVRTLDERVVLAELPLPMPFDCFHLQWRAEPYSTRRHVYWCYSELHPRPPMTAGFLVSVQANGRWMREQVFRAVDLEVCERLRTSLKPNTATVKVRSECRPLTELNAASADR